jgi:hypothetical protein
MKENSTGYKYYSHKFDLNLNTTHKDFVDWFKKQYSPIMLESKGEEEILIFQDIVRHKGILNIKSTKTGIHLTGNYENINNDFEWSKNFEIRCIKSFGMPIEEQVPSYGMPTEEQEPSFGMSTKEQEPKKNVGPWMKSLPNKRDRDKIIWESREDGKTWEDVSEAAKCGESTAKEVYKRLKKREDSS